jgi:hypothetical protein
MRRFDVHDPRTRPERRAPGRLLPAGVALLAVLLLARTPANGARAAQPDGSPDRTQAVNTDLTAPDPCETAGTCIIQLQTPLNVGQTGTATLRFGRDFLLCGTNILCVDPTTGAPILINTGSILNGTVVFSIADSRVASWVNAQPNVSGPPPSSTAGFAATVSQTLVRCGFFPTTALPASPPFQGGQPPLSQFLGGCESASAQYRGNSPGVTAVNATFIPDLPGAAGQFSALPPTVFPSQSPFGQTRTLEVIGAAPVGDMQLVRGCNNVSPTVSEAASAYAGRVNPAGNLVAIWEHQAATNTFRAYSPQAGAPNDLASVTRLRPVFVCVSAPTTLAQPPA